MSLVEFKVELPRVPDVIPSNGYVSAKHYLKCSNSSCDVRDTQNVILYITKLGSNTGDIRIGDEVLLSSHKSGVRQGEWIICEDSGCFSSQTCMLSSYNASSGQVNFAFNKSGCKDYVLKVSSKTLKQNETIKEGNGSKIILEYSNPRTTQEWLDCSNPDESCKRTDCEVTIRTNFTHLRQTASTTCVDQMDEFEAIFVS